MALIGTTITPYMQLYEAAAVADQGIGPEEYHYERIDAVGGAICPTSSPCSSSSPPPPPSAAPGPLTSAAEAAQALEPVAGHGAEALFGIGLLGRLRPGRRRGAPVDRLRRRRGGRGRAVGVAQLPRGTAVPRAVHRPDRRSARPWRSMPGNLIHLLINTQVLKG